MRPPSPRVRGIVLIAVAAAGGAALALGPAANPYRNPDSHAFESLARSLLAGHGMVYREPMLPELDLVAFRSPAYAAFLALALGLIGLPGALALQGALAGLTAVGVGDIGRRLAGPRVGVLAGALLFAAPTTWRYAGQLMSETLYASLAVGAVWLALATAGPGRVAGRFAAAAGSVAALALLARPTGIALIGALVVWLGRRSIHLAAILLVVAALVWAPWPIRNAQRLGSFVPLLTSGGLNAWNGNTGRPIGEGWEIQAREWGRGEIGLDRLFWHLTLDEARRHPTLVARRAVGRVYTHLAPLGSDPAGWVYRLAWPLAALAAAVALARADRWRRVLSLPGSVWACHLGLAALTVVNERYRHPTDWVVYLAAACGVEMLRERFGSARGAWIAAAISVVSFAAIELLRPII